MYKENKKRVTVWRFVFAAVTALVLCAVCVGSVSAWSADTTWGSDYDSASVFYIADADDLAQFADMVNDGKNFTRKTVILSNDIVLNSDMSADNLQEWTPIGKSSRTPFAGTFDGQRYTISGVYQYLGWSWGGGDTIGGLFGYVTGTITGLNLASSTFILDNGGVTLGSLVAVLDGGNVNNCNVDNTVSIQTQGAGGWIGGFLAGYTVGGVVGVNDGGIVYAADVTANVDEELMHIDILGNQEYGPIVGNNVLIEASDVFYITAVSGVGGTISSPGETPVEAGKSVVYILSPANAYEIDTVLVDRENVTSQCIEYSSYTFSNVQANHTISVTYKLALDYMILIPYTMVIANDTNDGDMMVTVTKLILPDAGKLMVNVVSENDFSVVHSSNASIRLPYNLSTIVDDVSVDLNQSPDAIVFTMDEFQDLNPEYPNRTITAELDEIPVYAGQYNDKLTFTVQYIES